ncbi:PREDICTED: uncharacterized protein LOC101308238 [Fragaria vesca subsp. vesca]|uniref:uncharacterized protein LOC101308238 n=1 Tax=Fragaria vesca subsp. vesca TaxID=101020 RepID=UPI0002C34529|nr:PREDICTED: uncharacterized protein LOC101308238 [Fragaria vesca subsp. vesca]
MATSSSSTVGLKLLIDTKQEKVLFAEAGKDFVDFLFSLLSLPLGTVIRLLDKDGMVGGFGKLYQSVKKLHHTYMQPNSNKDVLLKPKAPLGSNILKLSNTESCSRKAIYMCASGKDHKYVSEDPKAKCPSCNQTLSAQTTYVASPSTTSEETSGAGGVGFVKGVVTYMIMDDLEVKPMSTISSITLLNRFNVKDVGVLQEKVVDLGMQEGVKLLKASLQSKSVLTSVFIGKKAATSPA